MIASCILTEIKGQLSVPSGRNFLSKVLSAADQPLTGVRTDRENGLVFLAASGTLPAPARGQICQVAGVADTVFAS